MVKPMVQVECVAYYDVDPLNAEFPHRHLRGTPFTNYESETWTVPLVNFSKPAAFTPFSWIDTSKYARSPSLVGLFNIVIGNQKSSPVLIPFTINAY